ncbi:cytochrome P450 [Pinirhizobacter soli]|uniref:cytochrome P450 n=1 Tax=Pinirhizobacter soli TaxID=2786953 RepID=UPI002029E0DE|nr:cytochrome P450 [Pinirhizobacter soli]
MNETIAADEVGLAPEAPAELRYGRRIEDLPSPKGQPFVGNALQLSGRQMHQKFTAWVREFGPMFRLQVFGHTIVIVSDSATAHGVMRERPDGFRRNGGLKTIMNELNIGGVFTAEGAEWRKQRKLVMSGLNAEVIRNFFPRMVTLTEHMLERWNKALDEGRAIDLRRDLKAMALDTIVGIAMGHDIDAVNQDGDPLQRDIDNMFQRLGHRTTASFPYWRYFKLPVDRAAERSFTDIDRRVAEFIRNTRERMEQQRDLQKKPANMLEAMITASEDPESGFTDEELVANAILSVIGGEDTTANSIGWMLCQLSQNPAAAAALTAEVDYVLRDAPLPREWEQMKAFPYLEAAHSETQRLKAVAPYLGLTANADCVVADTFIPKNTAIIVATAGEGGDEAHFPAPEQFKPERWIDELREAGQEDPSRKLFPFGGGARLCPGRFLALTEIKVVVAMIMRNFELEPDPKAPPAKELLNFFMAPSSVPVRLKKRVPSAGNSR